MAAVSVKRCIMFGNYCIWIWKDLIQIVFLIMNHFSNSLLAKIKVQSLP